MPVTVRPAREIGGQTSYLAHAHIQDDAGSPSGIQLAFRYGAFRLVYAAIGVDFSPHVDCRVVLNVSLLFIVRYAAQSIPCERRIIDG